MSPIGPILPLHRRRRHRRRHLARLAFASLTRPLKKSFKGKKKISWMEVIYAGGKAFTKFNNWLPDDTVAAFQHFLVGIKGPLTTPVGGRYPFAQRRPSPDARSLRLPAAGAIFHPAFTSPVIADRRRWTWSSFRENTEDIYAGIEYEAGTPESQKILDFLAPEFP